MKTIISRLKVAWPLVIFLSIPAPTHSETVVQAWVQRYNGPGNGGDGAIALAVDGSNNVIVTGGSTGSAGVDDYATIEYSSAGVPLWTNRYNGPGDGYDDATALAVDGGGNVIVTGYSDGIGGSLDYATIKYSSAGVPLWTNRYNGPGNGVDRANAVAVDSSGNVIVTGQSSGGGGIDGYLTIKYSSAGVPLWTNRFNGTENGNDGANAVAVDSSGNVIVTGHSYSIDISTLDYATIKYSSAGVPLWTNRYTGQGYTEATALVVDGSNNVIVTGYSSGYGTFDDYVTIKYSSAGVPLWTNRYNGTENGDDDAAALAVDSSGNVIVTGHSFSSGATIKYSSAGLPLWTNRYIGNASAVAVDGSNNVIVTGYSGNLHYVTIKYSSAGVPLWTKNYNGPYDDEAAALAVDSSGNVIVAGGSQGIGSDYEFATIKYVSVPTPVVTGLELTNGTFRMRVDAVFQPGTLVIEASTNMAVWSPTFTNSIPTNVLFYTDPKASNYLRRFYRAFQFP